MADRIRIPEDGDNCKDFFHKSQSKIIKQNQSNARGTGPRKAGRAFRHINSTAAQ